MEYSWRGIRFLCFMAVYGTCLSAAQLVTHPVKGIVGESLTFPVEIPNLQPDTEINWRYGVRDLDLHIARIQNGKIDVSEDRFKGRLQLDDMSSSLRINGLEREDSGIYQVEEFKGNKFKKRFHLSVYNPVPEPHVEKINGSVELANRSCILQCFVGNPSEVNVSWIRDGKPLHTTELEISQEMQEGDVTYTCVASNPASNKTTTVTPSHYCDKRKGNEDDDTRNHILIPVIVIAVIGVLAVLSITLYLRRRKTAFEKEGSERSRNSSCIVYAEVTTAPPAGSGEDIPELAAARQTTAKLTTIYDELRTPSSQNALC